jgi:hypothetical protein
MIWDMEVGRLVVSRRGLDPVAMGDGDADGWASIQLSEVSPPWLRSDADGSFMGIAAAVVWGHGGMQGMIRGRIRVACRMVDGRLILSGEEFPHYIRTRGET